MREIPRIPESTLGLRSDRITDDKLQIVAGLSGFNQLVIRSSEITDEGLMQIAGLRGVSTLSIGGSQITSAGVQALQARMPECRVDRVWW